MAPARDPCQRNGEEETNVTSLRVLELLTDLGTRAVKNISLQYNNANETTDIQERLSGTSGNVSLPEDENSSHTTHSMTRLHEFQIIKAVVLAAVTVVILISICKMVFQLFVRYTVKHDKN